LCARASQPAPAPGPWAGRAAGRGRGGGTGLGLAILQNIVVNGLKAKVENASLPGEGTTVTVQLPRVVPDLPVAAC